MTLYIDSEIIFGDEDQLFLSLKIQRNLVTDYFYFNLDKPDMECDFEIIKELFDILKDQINNSRENFISGSISLDEMNEKYGNNFLDKLENFKFEDFDFFSNSIFLGSNDNPLIIVPTNKDLVFLYQNKKITINLNEINLSIINLGLLYISLSQNLNKI